MEKACVMNGHLLIILAGIPLAVATVALVLFAGTPRDNPRNQSPDEQRLPVTCTCGARRFCDGGCGVGGSVHAEGDTDARR